MNGNQDKSSDELCPGGKILQASVLGSLGNIERMVQEQGKNYKEIAESIVSLRMDVKEYSTRDLERIESLEKSRDCKSKKLREAEQETQALKVNFATHIGEHKTKHNLTVVSGVGGAGGLLGIWEFVKYLLRTGS